MNMAWIVFTFIAFHLDFSYVTLLEGRETSLVLNKKSKQEKKSSLITFTVLKRSQVCLYASVV